MSRLACICVLNVPLSLSAPSFQRVAPTFVFVVDTWILQETMGCVTCIIVVAGANNQATRSLRLSFPRDRGGERSFRSKLKNVFLSRGRETYFYIYIYKKGPDVSFSNTRFRKEASTVSSSLHHEISIPERGTCSHNAGA